MPYQRILIWNLLFYLNFVSGAKILGLFAYPGKSHFLVSQPLLKELTKRGHHLTVVSYYEENKKTENYTGIRLPEEEGKFAFLNLSSYETNKNTPFTELTILYKLSLKYENVLSLKELTLLQNEKFDLVITELFNSYVMYGLIHKIGAPPVVAFSSCPLFPWLNTVIGNSNNPSYTPVMMTEYSTNMTFTERVYNTFYSITVNALYNFYFQPVAQNLAEKYFGELPSLQDIAEKTSILFVNTHFTIFGAVPMIPKLIEVGGIHIPAAKPLPMELQDLMNKYEGVIYFSMGSVINAKSMSEEKINTFLHVFSELKQLVLWKGSQEHIKQKSNNIYTSEWFAQGDILANPKIELFISHCGLLGTLEAVHYGVPVLCIPIFADQHLDGKAITNKNMGAMLYYSEMNKKSLTETVNELLTNPIYKENAKKVSKAFNDRPMSPLDTAVYWTEYVIRHKGAPHMKSVIQELYWYQYYNIDIICTFFILIILMVYLINVIFKFCLYFFSILQSGNVKKVKSN